MKRPKTIPKTFNVGGDILASINDKDKKKKKSTEPDDPTYYGGELDEVHITGKKAPWVRYRDEFKTNNPLNIEAKVQNRFDNPVGREAIRKNNPKAFKKELRGQEQAKYDEQALSYARDQVTTNNPQGYRSREQYLNSMPESQETMMKQDPKWQPSMWNTLQRGVNNTMDIMPGTAAIAMKRIHENNNLYTTREKGPAIRELNDHPYMSKATAALDILAPLGVPAKIVQSTYKDDYTLEDAIKGKNNNADMGEDILTDPLNAVGVGLGAGILKTAKAGRAAISATARASKQAGTTARNMRNFIPSVVGPPSKPVMQVGTVMEGSTLLKQANKKGEISTDLVRNFLNKNSTPAADKEVISKVLEKQFKGRDKITIEELKKAVDGEIVPLKKINSNMYADYGVDRIKLDQGHNDKVPQNIIDDYQNSLQRRTQATLAHRNTPFNPETFPQTEAALNRAEDAYEKASRAFLDARKPIKENGVIGYESPEILGTGSNKHGYGEGNLAHTRYIVTKTEPDVFHVLEAQSDYYQGDNPARKLAKAEKKRDIHRSQRNVDYSQFNDDEFENLIMPPWNDAVDNAANAVAKEKTYPGYRQKELLNKNWEERILQENMVEAASKGQSKIRYPTSETAAKVQAYRKDDNMVHELKTQLTQEKQGLVADMEGLMRRPKGEDLTDSQLERIADMKAENPIYNPEELIKTFKASNKEKGIDFEAQIKELQKEIKNIDRTLNDKLLGYPAEHKTILSKYENTPKLMKKGAGVEPKIVTDHKGNTWYEIDIPEKFKKKNPEIKALSIVGGATTIGAGAYGTGKTQTNTNMN